jgi:ligand-binding sensor domain-containing protein/DNA-binding CsgD family transcriptional regulator
MLIIRPFIRSEIRLEILLFSLVSLVLPLHVAAQAPNLGIPPIWNFSKKQYHAGTQNWDATQDDQGVMYFANNEGVLRYDGVRWRCFPTPNRTVVRAVAWSSAEQKLYVGAQGELGYFSFQGPEGRWLYQSLTHLLPESERIFEDVWDIVFFENQVFFRTNRSVFRYYQHTLQVEYSGAHLNALFASARGLVLQKGWQELLRWEQGQFRNWQQLPCESPLTGVFSPNGASLVFSTLKDGLFRLTDGAISAWTIAANSFLKNNRIYATAAMPGNRWALATSLDGLLIMDASGQLLMRLNKRSGLQNNNILSVFSDHAGNLWLGLDSGIDCVAPDAAFRQLIPDNELEGTGYAAAVYQDHLYLGVSNGIYMAPWQAYYNPLTGPEFKKIAGSDGQVWSLLLHDNQLMAGHHEGAFQWNTRQLNSVSRAPGAWNFVPMSPQYAIGGHYGGLVLYKKEAGAWREACRLAGLTESCRFLVKDQFQGDLWVSHPYRGVFRVRWSEMQPDSIQVDFCGTAQGFPSNNNNYVFSVAGKAVFCTEKGIYRFDPTQGRFVPDADFNACLQHAGPIRYLREDQSGNIWYVGAREVGRLLVQDLGVKKVVQRVPYPELREKLVAGFEYLYPIDNTRLIFGTEHGFLLYNANAPAEDSLFQLVLSEVHARIPGDSLLYAGGGTLSPTLAANMNHLYFEFAATDYREPAFVRYRYQMDGLSGGWSEWSAEASADFSNLAPGKYTFKVQAQRRDGRLSNIVSYRFRIRPPWYASPIAFWLYAAVVIGLFGGYSYRQRRKFELEKAQLTVQHLQKTEEQQRQVEMSRAALLEISHEKMEDEIRFKNQELASATMHLVQKGALLSAIQEQLHQMLEKSTQPAVKKEIRQLLGLLDFDAKLDEDWAQFAFHFDQVHVNFLQRLREQFPQLSTNDHRLCAYLRMNLSSKEIAPLMNISIRGVEASRYRLRKKLGLNNDANLAEFILNI